MQLEQRFSSLSITLANDIKRVFMNFIQTYEQQGQKKYIKKADSLLQNHRHLMEINLTNFLHYHQDMAQMIFDDYYKYQPYLNDSLTQFMREHQKNVGMHEEGKQTDENKDKYEVAFDAGLCETGAQSVRSLTCSLLGKLRSFKGTVTRTSEVRPQLTVGVFTCKLCGKKSEPVVQQFKYTQPKKCRGDNCDKSSWDLDLKRSQFADFQRLRIQQNPTTIPPGAMPRSIDVILRNQNVEKGQPGDICEVIGYLSVLPQISSMLKPGQRTQVTTRSTDTRGNMIEQQGITGLKGIRDLNYKLIFIAINIKVENNQFDQELLENQQEDQNEKTKQPFNQTAVMQKIYSKLTQHEIMTVKKVKQNPKIYQQMAQSLFPSIFGHAQIKKALLLQLLSGIHKKTQNRINIRGDINILIVGDPSTAKSQFLKSVNKFVPRSVYTNGKTTSAAGLTASVTRDQMGNVGIEAGALMLADNGICCIDQFDKMQIKDQVAIHQAMQQQTISIAKAGVYATLNARTSVLAAANPLFGRYDKSKSLKNNIDLSAPMMSRFDLFFVVCDQANQLADNHLSKFIINMHRDNNTIYTPKYDTKTIKLYLALARKLKPRLTIESAELLRRFYIEIRNRDKSNVNTSYRVTVRQLQSMIRLSQAYARLHLDNNVEPMYVRQAYRLLSCSILKLQKSPIELQDDLLQGFEKLNLRTQNMMDEELLRKKQERKKKPVSISHQMYQEIQKSVLSFFKDKQNKHLKDQIDDQNQISQEDLCTYLLTVNYDKLSTIEETDQMRKVVNAVIKKMIRDQRMLMIVQDSQELDRKILSLHPNYIDLME